MRISKALFLIASLSVLVTGIAAAQANPPESFGTPDGLPPSLEEVCDGTSGAAHGLCIAYCEAMDCESSAPQASEQACTRVGDRFVQITGGLPPCLQSCPCWEPGDLDNVTAENQLPFGSCEATGGGMIIQNDGSTSGLEGGFGVFDFGDGPVCATRDMPPYGIAVTPEEFDNCVAQIVARCEVIGAPGDGAGDPIPAP